MNEEERAEWLARAIEDLLNRERARSKEPPPPDLDKEELDGLMRIAAARAEASDSRLETAHRYEGEVWQRLIQRLDRRRFPRNVRPLESGPSAIDVDESAAARELERMEIEELREIARMRRMMAERAASIADDHREDVWQRVQSRLRAQRQPKKRWGLVFFRPRAGDERLDDALDRVAAGDEVLDCGEEEVDSIVRVARTRRYWSHLTRQAAQEREGRLWARITTAISQGRQPGPGGAQLGLKLAMAAAVAAIVIAALGPLPATGFAGHPLAGLIRSVGEHIGVTETSAPPAVLAQGSQALGTEITATEASRRLGVAVGVPAEAPPGFELTSSRFFEQSLTADSGGTFALTYSAADGRSVVIFHEQASGADFAVGGGAATNVMLSDGTAGTYVDGMWQAVDGALKWSAGGAQTLVFERNGVRTTIQYTGPVADAPSLFAVADSMTAAAP